MTETEVQLSSRKNNALETSTVMPTKRQCINVRLQTDFFERTNILESYYEDVRSYNLLSKEEEVELIKEYKFGTTKEKLYARNKLISHNQRFVIAVAKRFATNENILDLINEGNIGLIKALDDFDETKDFKFISFAVWYIRREINAYCISYGKLVKKQNISKTYHVVTQASNKFFQKEMRNPTTEELKDILINDYNIKINDSSDIIDLKVDSIDESYDSDEETTYNDINTNYTSKTSAFNDYEKNVEYDSTKHLITSLLSKLSSRDKLIVEMSYGIGYNREYSNAEIAEKVGLTTERVRQILSSTIKVMKEKVSR